MKQTPTVIIPDLGGNLPNELILMAYYPVARTFNIARHTENGDNPEFFSMLTVLLNPNLDIGIQFKRKSLAEKYSKKTESLKKRYTGERLEAELEKVSAYQHKKEAELASLVEMKGKLFENLAKLTPDKIASFLDGKPVLQQEVSNDNSQCTTSMIASKDSLILIEEQNNNSPKTSIIYCAQDREKANKALQREKTSTSNSLNK